MSLRGEVGWEDLDDMPNDNDSSETNVGGLRNGTVAATDSSASRKRSTDSSALTFAAAPPDSTDLSRDSTAEILHLVNGRDSVDDDSAESESGEDDVADDVAKSAAGNFRSKTFFVDELRQQRFRQLLENMPDEEPVWSNVDDVETPDSASEADALNSRAEVPFLLQSFVPDDYTVSSTVASVTLKTPLRSAARQRKRSTASSAAVPDRITSDDDEEDSSARRHAPDRKQQQKAAASESKKLPRKKQSSDAGRVSTTTDASSRRNISTSTTITDGNDEEEFPSSRRRNQQKQQRRSVNGSEKNTRKSAEEKRSAAEGKDANTSRHAATQQHRRRPPRTKPAESCTTEQTNHDEDFQYNDDEDDDDVENDTFTNTYFTETAPSERYTATSVATDKTMTQPYNPHQFAPQHAVRTPYGTFLPYSPAVGQIPLNASMYWQPATPGTPFNMPPYGGMMMHPSQNPYAAAYYNQQQQQQQMMPWMNRMPTMNRTDQVPFMMMPHQQFAAGFEGQNSNNNSLSRRQPAAEAAQAGAAKLNRPTSLAFQQQQQQSQPTTDVEKVEQLAGEKPTADEPAVVEPKQFSVPHAVGAFIGDATIVLEFQRKFPGELNFAILPALSASSSLGLKTASDGFTSNQPLDSGIIEILRHFPGNLPLLALLHKTADGKQQCALTYNDSVTSMPVEKQVFALCDKMYAYFLHLVNNSSRDSAKRSDECLLWELLMLFCQPANQQCDMLDVMLEKIIRSYVMAETATVSRTRNDINGDDFVGGHDDEGTSSADEQENSKSDGIISKIKLCLLQGDRAAAFETSLSAVRSSGTSAAQVDADENGGQKSDQSSDAVIHSVLLGAIVDNGSISGACLVRLSRLLYNSSGSRGSTMNSNVGAALSTLYKLFTFEEPVSCDTATQRTDGGTSWREHVFILMACCMLRKNLPAASGSSMSAVQRRASQHDDSQINFKNRVTKFLSQISEKLMEKNSYAASDACLLLGFMLFTAEQHQQQSESSAVLTNKLFFLRRLMENINSRLARDLAGHYERMEAHKLHGGSSAEIGKSVDGEHSGRFVLDYCTLQVVSYLFTREGIIAALAGSKKQVNLDADMRDSMHLDYEFYTMQLLLSPSNAGQLPVLCRIMTVLLNCPQFSDLVVDAVVDTSETKQMNETSSQWWTHRAQLQRFIEQCLLQLTSARHRALQHRVLGLLNEVLSATTAAVDSGSVSRRSSIAGTIVRERIASGKAKTVQLPSAVANAALPPQSSASQQLFTQDRLSGRQLQTATAPSTVSSVGTATAPTPSMPINNAESNNNQQKYPQQSQQQQQLAKQHQDRRFSGSAADASFLGSNISSANLAIAARPLVGSGGRLGLKGSSSPTGLSRQITAHHLAPITEDATHGSLSSPIESPTKQSNMRSQSSAWAFGPATSVPPSASAAPGNNIQSLAPSTTTLTSTTSSTDVSSGSYIYPGQYLQNKQDTASSPTTLEKQQPQQQQQQTAANYQQNTNVNQAEFSAAGGIDAYSDFGYSIPYEGGGGEESVLPQQPNVNTAMTNTPALQQQQLQPQNNMMSNSRPAMVGANSATQQAAVVSNSSTTPNNQNSNFMYGYEDSYNHDNNINNNTNYLGNAEAGGHDEDDYDRRTFDDDDERTSSQAGSVADNLSRQPQNYGSFVHYPGDENYQQHYQQHQQQQPPPQQQQLQQPQQLQQQQQQQQQYLQPTNQFSRNSMPPQMLHHQQSMPANFHSQQYQQPMSNNLNYAPQQYQQQQQNTFEPPNSGASSSERDYHSAYGSSGSGVENTTKNDAAEKPKPINTSTDAAGGGAMKKSGSFLRTLSSYIPQRLSSVIATAPTDIIGGSGAKGGKAAKKMVLPYDKNPQFVYENGMWIDKKNPQASLAALAPPPPPPAGNSGTSTPLGGAGLSDFYRLGHPASSPNLRAMGGGPAGAGGMPPPMPTRLFGPPI